MFDALKQLTEEKKALDAKMREAGEKAVREALREFFAAHPEVKRVRWRQYTPYFNDGEPCVFRVRGIGVDLGDGPEAGEYEDGFVDEYELKDKPELKASFAELAGGIKALEGEMKAAFGDHAIITATPEAITVEEYDHD